MNESIDCGYHQYRVDEHSRPLLTVEEAVKRYRHALKVYDEANKRVFDLLEAKTAAERDAESCAVSVRMAHHDLERAIRNPE